MSATDSQNVIIPVDTNATTTKKPRAKTLPAKYNKFIQFGYYFVQKLTTNDTPVDLPLDQNTLFNLIHLFDSVENQQAFVQDFFDNSKDINKEIRKLVTAHKKNASKPPKAPKTNQRRKKTQVVTDVQDELVNELVLLAQTEPQTIPDAPKKATAKKNKKNQVDVVPEPVHNNTPVLSESEMSPLLVQDPILAPVPVPAKKARKTPAKKNVVEPTPATIPLDIKPTKNNKKNKDVVAPTVTETEPAATKPKKNNKKNKDVVITPAPEPVIVPAPQQDDDDEDEPLAVSIIIINDVTYFIDEEFSLYHHETQEPVGTFIDKQLSLY